MAPSKEQPQATKKAKLYNSRTIRAENADPSLRNGILNTSEYITSREFEIRSFEVSQHNTRNAASTRIFQSLPRTLRRRTASHNVKRIPPRLRKRALHEMNSSGLSKVSKKRRTGRQLHYLKTRKKLLQIAWKLRRLKAPISSSEGTIKERISDLNRQLNLAQKETKNRLNNTNGAYDNISTNKLCAPRIGVKYGNRQRKFAWTPNHIWHAKRFHMFKRWGWHMPLSPNQKCFRAVTRASGEYAVGCDTSYYGSLVIRCPDLETAKTAINTFTVYNKTIPSDILGGEKAYNDWLYLDEKQAALVSGFFEPRQNSLLIRLHPADYVRCFEAILEWAQQQKGVEVDDCRYALGSIELRGPAALNYLAKIACGQTSEGSLGTLLEYGKHFDSNLVPVGTVIACFVRDPSLLTGAAHVPFDTGHKTSSSKTESKFKQLLVEMSSTVDHDASEALLVSEKRSEAYENMHAWKAARKTGSKKQSKLTPALIYKLRSGAWCIIMPWFFIQPLWMRLQETTLNRFQSVGYRQMHQLDTEAMRAHYPHDFPFTVAGYQEHQLNSTSIQIARDKLPSSKKSCHEKTEDLISSGCDWWSLQKWIFGQMLLGSLLDKTFNFGEFNGEHNRVVRNSKDLMLVIHSLRRPNDVHIPVASFNAGNAIHKAFVEGSFKPDISKFPALPVIQIALLPTKRGTIKNNARIYSRANESSHDSLVGFVTSALFNQHLGNPSAIGVVSAQLRDSKVVYVRNVGCTTFIAARLSLL
ncbi:hypothetical protein PUMCH_003983 [Australozyma saopauloensis]|uniref:Uncharacterized protein n=1 Tax=Australozyma saopauloensis TaxID=291208 RepID=A0AAX4HG55_9ASCO|nr:hypothetical protein PUMCH_003983 [[Candida] saopauloensis]